MPLNTTTFQRSLCVNPMLSQSLPTVCDTGTELDQDRASYALYLLGYIIPREAWATLSEIVSNDGLMRQINSAIYIAYNDCASIYGRFRFIMGKRGTARHICCYRM